MAATSLPLSPPLHPRHSPTNLTGRGAHLAIISILFTTVAVSLVCSRLATRWVVRQALGGCDVAITVSVVVAIGMTVVNCVAVVHGLGKGEATLEMGDLRVALKAFWATQILYTLTTMLTKTSIVFMYMRIFPNPKFHRIAWIVVAYVNLCGIAGIGSTVDECTPRERIWNKEVSGTCIDLAVFWYMYASANMVGDFAILALPVPAVKGLNLPQRQKMGILLVFALGGFVCITSILRMTTLKRGAPATDLTYGTLDFVIWSTIEANMAIICACLPMLKAPLARLFPRLFPRGSTGSDMTCPSIAAFCRPGQLSGSPNASSHSYDNWGRLESKRQMDMVRVSTGAAAAASIPTPTLSKHSTGASIFSDKILCSDNSTHRLSTTGPTCHLHRQPGKQDLINNKNSSNNAFEAPESWKGKAPNSSPHPPPKPHPQKPRPAHTRGSGGSEAQLMLNF